MSGLTMAPIYTIFPRYGSGVCQLMVFFSALIVGIVVFCRCYQRSFFEIADVLAIAAAYIMGVGRIGNFDPMGRSSAVSPTSGAA